MRFRYRRDRNISGRMSHSFCIGHGAEDGYLIIWGSKCFDTFKSLLGVVQGRCHAMDTEVGVLDELGFAPFAGLGVVVGFYMAIDCIICKPRVNMNTKCSHMPSRTLKPMLSQSAELSATAMKLGSRLQYQCFREVEEGRALRQVEIMMLIFHFSRIHKNESKKEKK